MDLSQLTTRIFADGADLGTIYEFVSDPRIAGFTTNPSLMRSAGLTNYLDFARHLLDRVTEHPVSFEVLADDLEDILRQAKIISRWGENVYVKIPVSTTKGEPTASAIRELSQNGIKVNITAIFTLPQLKATIDVLANGAPAFVSIFAGRIADAGIDPLPTIAGAVELLEKHPQIELIWASTREVLNLIQANSVGCHIITMSPSLLDKLGHLGKDLTQFSLETVKAFRSDSLAAGLTL